MTMAMPMTLPEFKDLADITCTNCAICGRSLTDSVSVNRGIGPICSRKYYDVEHNITDDMVAEALGCLHASKIDSRVKMYAKRLKRQPRNLCNLLVKWASANFDEQDVVIECAEVIDSLGFDLLAQVLRERNTKVHIAEDTDRGVDSDGGTTRFTLHTPSRYYFRRNMSKVPDVQVIDRKGRLTCGWSFPKEQKDLVWTILGDAFGGRWATVPGKVVRIPAMSYNDVLAALDLAHGQTQADRIVRVVSPTRIEVHTPRRNFGFVGDLKQLPRSERRWNPDKVCWEVKRCHEAAVRALVNTHFTD